MKTSKHLKPRRDIHADITESIIAAIEAGTDRFELPWHRSGPAFQRPRNAVTRQGYNGVNIIALWASAGSCGFSSPLWATYRQWQSIGAQVRKGERAFYSPAGDFICIPPRERFTGSTTSTATESYYATLLHELTHWTGAPSRCDRNLTGRFGDDAYAMEELVADLGAAFLCSDLGITSEPRPDHASYLASWLKILKDDTRAIFTAASKASEAAAFLTGLAAEA